MTPLRDRLQTLLDSALARLMAEEAIDPGMLRLAADAWIALAALEARVSRETRGEL